jgi:deoxyribonuclease IV
VQAQTSRGTLETHPRTERRRAPESPATSQRIGMHTSIAGGFLEALEAARRLRCTTMQIFSASPRMWADNSRAIDPGRASEFRERRKELEIGPLVIHANYLINLAAPNGGIRTKTIRGFRGELERAVTLGAEYLVVHPGSRRESSMDAAIGQIARSLRESAEGIDLGRLQVLIEITAGQGSAVGSRLEELHAILDGCPGMELGVCLDTAHLFAAGYELQDETGFEKTVEEIDRWIGLDRVHVVHVNDSKAAFASHVDRHEHLGHGQIGLDALRRIVNHPRLAACAFILETPIDRPGDDWRNVRALWRLAGVERKRPAGSGDAMSRGGRKVKRAAVRRKG